MSPRARSSAGESAPGEGPERAPGWAKLVVEDDFSWSEAVGGARGLVESILPGLVFVVVFVLTRDLVLTSALAAGAALIALGLRLLARQPLTQAISGLIGVGIGVVWALASGKGENFYAWGLLTSGAFLLAILVSILVRRPAVTLALGLAKGWEADWARAAAERPLARRCLALTWLWAALFAVRVGVEAPLWAMGAVGELGVAKLILGVPAFALVCWATWIGLRPFLTEDPGTGAGQAHPVEG